MILPGTLHPLLIVFESSVVIYYSYIIFALTGYYTLFIKPWKNINRYKYNIKYAYTFAIIGICLLFFCGCSNKDLETEC